MSTYTWKTTIILMATLTLSFACDTDASEVEDTGTLAEPTGEPVQRKIIYDITEFMDSAHDGADEISLDMTQRSTTYSVTVPDSTDTRPFSFILPTGSPISLAEILVHLAAGDSEFSGPRGERISVEELSEQAAKRDLRLKFLDDESREPALFQVQGVCNKQQCGPHRPSRDIIVIIVRRPGDEVIVIIIT